MRDGDLFSVVQQNCHGSSDKKFAEDRMLLRLAGAVYKRYEMSKN